VSDLFIESKGAGRFIVFIAVLRPRKLRLLINIAFPPSAIKPTLAIAPAGSALGQPLLCAAVLNSFQLES